MSPESKRPLVLVILDGWGFGKKRVGNPIAEATKPVMDSITNEYPMTLLQASGSAVGMTWGESGNSEVGHLNIGAGRIVEQYLSRINRAVTDKTFFSNPAFVGAFNHAKSHNSKVHIIGLLTSGTVHAAFSHIPALLELAAQNQQPETYLHLFSDGKDSGLQEAPQLLEKVENEIKQVGYGKIASLIGRNFAMDRDNNWELTKTTYDLLVHGAGEKTTNYSETIRNHYSQGENDSNMPPILIDGSGFTGIANDDALIFFNFREDSMRQLLKTFVETNFTFFARAELKNLYVSAMTRYLDNSLLGVAFPPPEIKNGLAEVLSLNGRAQLHVAETEKYAHATYFFNGLQEKEYGGETDIFIDSVKDHENDPAMKSQEIAARTVEEINQSLYDFIVLNFANADVLAHSGNYKATVTGIEAVDRAVGLIKEASLARGGTLIITADHGNAESLTYKGSGEAETRHNDSPVPFYVVAAPYKVAKSPEKITQETKEISGILADIAPTVLELMGIIQPPEMTGKSLLSILGAK